MLLKSIPVIYTSIVSFFYSIFMLFQDSGVIATIKVPENIRPGETVIAEVTIKKGNIGGFAKLQIETGQGLSISENENKGATFSFSGNTAKWIWTALPMDAEFKVKFKLTANASASGNTSISGKFSYIVNNAKQVTEIPTKSILIGSTVSEAITQTTPPTTSESPSATPSSTIQNESIAKEQPSVEVNTQGNVNVTVTTSETPAQSNTTSAIPPTNNTHSANVNITRNIEVLSTNKFLIKITINKDKIKGFARYSDVLPPGLSAKAEEKDESSFFVDGNSVKFVWSNLPDKPLLIISYILSGNISSPVTLNGEFSYTENNQVMSKTLSPETIQPKEPISKTNTTVPSPTTNVTESSIQAKQTAVFFSVQLGAFLKSNISTNYFIKKYHIKNVEEENHDSYRKFYSGNFDEYKKARDYREEVKVKGIQDAFVIAHKNNIRITVQEALMITNQKWYP
ncbi:MAG: hypothetical protein N2203_07265 [Bacteroidia bacterium]|nr:hypothetical protein [Bacteroidia bacterium]